MYGGSGDDKMWAENEKGPEETTDDANLMFGGDGDDWMKGSAARDQIFGDDYD